jgi:cell division protein FtsI (penicillin-binding protein 3)
MNTKRDILIRVYLSFLLFALVGVLVIFQISKIQFRDGEKYRSMSENFSIKYDTIEPIRGNIYSANEKLLVTSLPIYELHIDFKTQYWQDDSFYYNNIDTLSKKLSKLFKDKTFWEYKTLLSDGRNKGRQYFLLKRNVNHNELKAIKSFPILEKGQYKGGLIVEQKSRRIYPFGILGSRTLGYYKKNTKKKIAVGLEGAFDNYLAGQSGKRLKRRISGGDWIPVNDNNELEPEDGKDIITTIDINLQDATESALLKTLKTHDANSGCAVVMEVKTGHIKAIANLEKGENGIYYETYNYAVGDATEPGSTFKLATAIVLLENSVDSDEKVDTENGVFQFYDRQMEDTKPHGIIDFKEAFEVSSNIYFARKVFDTYSGKAQKFIDDLNELGITKPLGNKIKGEGDPVFKNPTDESWSGTTLPWMAMGYELQMTPLQLLTLYNAVANNGVMLKPMFVTEVRNVDKVVERFEPQVINEKICSRRTLESVQEMLVGVVKNGTAKNIYTPAYQIAGKTGTALVAYKGSYDNTYQASFAGYFPADNPKYSCIVVINKPSAGSIYGSQVAAPVFREIADKVYINNFRDFDDQTAEYVKLNTLPINKYSFKKDANEMLSYIGIPISQSAINSEWAYLKKNNSKVEIENKSMSKNRVPDVRGMTLSEALYLLENMGLEVNVNGVGKVRKQSLEPGTESNKYKSISIYLS